LIDFPLIEYATLFFFTEKFLAMDLDEKRLYYKCKGNYRPIEKIRTWPEYFDKYIKNGVTQLYNGIAINIAQMVAVVSKLSRK